MTPRTLSDLPTPALLVERSALESNLDFMAAALPGARMRPHVKAHKCTTLSRLQRDAGHPGVTAATIRECEGLAEAGLGTDILLANEVTDARRLGALVEAGHRITLAVDSEATIDVAAAGGVREVVIDVCVDLPRCGCSPEDAGWLADLARAQGLEVRGVMGYEGHLMLWADAEERRSHVEACMAKLLAAHDLVGGPLVTGAGTGTWSVNTWVNEVQAGSYALMDSAYAKLGDLPFQVALTMLGTVISVNRAGGWAVADTGLKAQGMDHGNPDAEFGAEFAQVWFLSDEHLTFAPSEPAGQKVGDRVRYVPAHVDPTIAYHEQLWLVDGDEVIERWPVDLRGW